jgi:hypothetical protein
MDLFLRVLAFLLGSSAVLIVLLSAVKTFVLPRGGSDWLARAVFASVRGLLYPWAQRLRSYARRDSVLAFYGPLSLLMLLPCWCIGVLLGYVAMFRALGSPSWGDAFRLSASSLFTLGFDAPDGWSQAVLALSEAAVGPLLVSLLIAYLPTIYAAFSRREAAVTLLEVRAGTPPSAVEMLKRFYRIHGLDPLTEHWQSWEAWFADIEESHTSLSALVFFRSPRPEHSWITAAGAVLDAASLSLSAVETPPDPQAALCIRAGYLALRHIADFFRISYDPDPQPGDPISIRRGEFDVACAELAANGLPIRPDRDQAWRDFAGWRVNYDMVLLRLAALVMAPVAPWSSDRMAEGR